MNVVFFESRIVDVSYVTFSTDKSRVFFSSLDNNLIAIHSKMQ